ncbi:MAG: DUF4249 domain-containing protein [Prolixibacteraceae bacterium]|jgi:hypothetical protein|nr:DUF4249 domain-containing protein [Prolixibacteraceae bacterium]
MFFSFVFCFFFLSSCEKDIHISIKGTEQLCFNCILNPDSLITAKLTLSRSISDNEDFSVIDNATVELKEDGEPLCILQNKGDGIYTFNDKPRAGAVYEVTVTASGFPQLKAETKVPEKPLVEYQILNSEWREQGKFYIYDMKYSINDPIGINRYWHYSIGLVAGIWRFTGYYDDINAPFIDDFNRVTDPAEEYGYLYRYYVRINDTDLDGTQLIFESTASSRKILFFMDSDEHYDKYLKSTIKQWMNSDEDIQMSEPVQIYTNITNGMGIFGSAAIRKIEL